MADDAETPEEDNPVGPVETQDCVSPAIGSHFDDGRKGPDEHVHYQVVEEVTDKFDVKLCTLESRIGSRHRSSLCMSDPTTFPGSAIGPNARSKATEEPIPTHLLRPTYVRYVRGSAWVSCWILLRLGLRSLPLGERNEDSWSMANEGKARLPPRWFIRFAWAAHRWLYRVTGGRVGLRRAKGNSWGTMRVTTTGRRSGQDRSVMLGYFEDGPNLVTMAMNGWGEAEPAWWLNLQANPEARVHIVDGRRLVKGRAAIGEERARLWDRWREIDTNLDGYAALRPGATAVVILEPTE